MSSTLAFLLMTLISARRGDEPSSWLILNGLARRLRLDRVLRGFGDDCNNEAIMGGCVTWTRIV
jgi:hypothetical protein